MANKTYSTSDALAGLAIFVAVFLAIIYGFWWLWTAVMPHVWPTGPEGLVSPGYWLFLGEWALLALVVRMLRGRR